MKKVFVGLMGLLFSLTLFSTAMAKTKWDLHLNYPAGNFPVFTPSAKSSPKQI